MKIAELFVGLGVKGAEQTGKALVGVKTGLSEVKSTSLETKAAILAVVYGLEQLMSQSAQMGTGLLNFSSLTGLSAQELQKWQYAARQAGVSGDELTSSLKAVQNITTNALLGKGAPEGWAMVANKVGLAKDKMRDTFYVMQKLQQFAQSVPQDVGNNMLKSFGISENTIAAMRRNAFTPDVMAKAPTYSDREIGQLNKVDVAWSNLGNKIQMAFGHLTSKHGMELVGDITKMTAQVIKLADALLILSERVKVFKYISEFVGGTADALKEITGFVEGKRNFFGEEKDEKGVTKKKHAEGGFFNRLFTEQHFEDFITDGLKDAKAQEQHGVAAQLQRKIGDIKPIWQNVTAPKANLDHRQAVTPRLTPVSQGATQNIEVTQTLNFQHEGKDAKKLGDSTSKAVKETYRQMQAQAQGS